MGDKVKVTVVQGPGATPSLYVADKRVAGGKPWGGGRVIAEWSVDAADLRALLAAPEPDGTPDDEEPCRCGRARDEHDGPYGEGACAKSGCEEFTSAAPEPAPEIESLPCPVCDDGIEGPCPRCEPAEPTPPAAACPKCGSEHHMTIETLPPLEVCQRCSTAWPDQSTAKGA